MPFERPRSIFASAARCAAVTASWAVAAATFMASFKVCCSPETSKTALKALALTHALASTALLWPVFLPHRCLYVCVLGCGGAQQSARPPRVAGAADRGRGGPQRRRGDGFVWGRATANPNTNPMCVCVRVVGPGRLQRGSRRLWGVHTGSHGRAGADCTALETPRPPWYRRCGDFPFWEVFK